MRRALSGVVMSLGVAWSVVCLAQQPADADAASEAQEAITSATKQLVKVVRPEYEGSEMGLLVEEANHVTGAPRVGLSFSLAHGQDRLHFELKSDQSSLLQPKTSWRSHPSRSLYAADEAMGFLMREEETYVALDGELKIELLPGESFPPRYRVSFDVRFVKMSPLMAYVVKGIMFSDDAVVRHRGEVMITALHVVCVDHTGMKQAWHPASEENSYWPENAPAGEPLLFCRDALEGVR